MKTVKRFLHSQVMGQTTAAYHLGVKQQQVNKWCNDDRVVTDGEFIYRKIGEWKNEKQN